MLKKHTYNENNRIKSGENLRLVRELERRRVAELGDISEYIYQSIMFEKSMPLLSEIFDEIAVSDTEHFRTLGEMILSLGVNPSVNMRVSSSEVDLMEDVNCRGEVEAPRVLERLIGSKRDAEAEYTRLSTLCGDSQLRSALMAMADAERAHAATLSSAASHLRRQ